MTDELSDSPLAAHHAERIDLPGRHGTLAALRARPASAKATVLLVPGYTGSKEDFAPLLDPLADAGFAPLAIDLPGQYESPGPDSEAAYTPDELGSQVTDLVGKLVADGERVLLLGHSYGGLVARAALLSGCQASGLILLDSGPSAITDPDRVAVLDHGTAVLRDKGIEAAWQLREQSLLRNPWFAGLPERLRTFHRERFLRSAPAALITMAEVLRTSEDLVAPLSRELAARAIPCLVACGEHDDAWSVPTQQRMAERLDADFAVLPGCGHSPNTENPSALVATLLPTWNTWLA